jgi:hypothetical protein
MRGFAVGVEDTLDVKLRATAISGIERRLLTGISVIAKRWR